MIETGASIMGIGILGLMCGILYHTIIDRDMSPDAKYFMAWNAGLVVAGAIVMAWL